MEIFVPGRICLLGEHTDWAGGYRRINSEIGKGFAIIVGTNQGLTAEVEAQSGRFILEAPWRREGETVLDVPMDRVALLEVAEEGGFFSYASGVAYQILTHYNVGGLRITNHTVDLPISKGLSSSAAICVLTARAFNRVYDLKMTVRGEMEYAYQGEITTPSRCGRMDQGCAYGDRPILMTFDGDRIDVTELKVGCDLHLVIVDLQAGKDTTEILAALNRCYPFAEGPQQEAVHRFLGDTSGEIVQRAIRAIEDGEPAVLGKLMTTALGEFDRALMPACPTQLTAPVLHNLLDHPSLQNLTLGGKSVGSGGDGTAQLLCGDAESQKRVIALVENELRMPCLPLVIHSITPVRKAVIPAAGFGTRLFPASKAVKKELFPIVDETGRAKPVILAIVEELLGSGIEEIAIVIQEKDREDFESLFGSLPLQENYHKLSPDDQAYCEELLQMGRHVSFLTQESQEGFGHAVLCAKEWVGSEAFLLALGDYVYQTATKVSCTRQLLEVHQRHGMPVVGVKTIEEGMLGRFGCVGGHWIDQESLLQISEFIEKPSIEEARLRLRIDGVSEGHYLGLFGQYILTPTIFDLLEQSMAVRKGSGELQLTPCLDRLRVQEGLLACRIKGASFDIGVPESYRQTVYRYPDGAGDLFS